MQRMEIEIYFHDTFVGQRKNSTAKSGLDWVDDRNWAESRTGSAIRWSTATIELDA